MEYSLETEREEVHSLFEASVEKVSNYLVDPILERETISEL